jgi:hypothetical protein
LNNITLGYYKKRYSHETINVSLERVLKNFAGDNFKGLIGEARQLYCSGQYEAYALFKGELPAVTFSGTFNSKRESASLKEYSGLIVLDMDKVGEGLKVIKDQLFEDKFVVAIWTSPSGDGLKFLIKTDCNAEDHKKVYANAVQYFTKEYNAKIDKSGSDVSRLCYVSSDEDLKHKNSFVPFSDNSLQIEKLKPVKAVPTNPFIGEDLISEKRLSMNQDAQKKTLRRIYHFLRKRNLSITASYEEWIKVAFAISNTFSYEVGNRYFLELCRLDGSRHNEEESEKLILNCYRKGISLSSFNSVVYLAQSKGYEFNFNKNRKVPKSK